VTITNNIVSGCNRGIIYFGSDVDGGLNTALIANNTLWNSTSTALSIAYSAANSRNIRIMNNIIQQSTGKLAWIENAAGVTLSNNFWMPGAPSSSSNASGANDKSGDVLFASSPTQDPLSFRLQSVSPAINGGIALSEVPSDFEGKTRLAPPDMGAIEYGTSSNPAGTALPNPPVWWWSVPEDLRNFLDQLYLLNYYFGRTSNLQYLLEGVIPTPTP
jgi:hypothetical protein